MFDLRSGIEIDLSLDSVSNPGRGASMGEEELTSVDISDNDLSSSALDERIERFRSVSIFRARRSGLSQVPWQSFGMLDALTILDLSGNQLCGCAMLERLPTTLRELNLSGNQLTGLTSISLELDSDGGTFTMPFLKSLDISNNQLESLPSALEAPILQTLNFSKNRIAILPTNLLAPCSRSLSTLVGKENQLSDPPPDLRSFQSLRTVDLGQNAFTDAPAISPSLVSLSLEGNRLSNLLNLFGGDQSNNESFQSSLTELRISSNKLTTLDEDVVQCLTSVVMIDASMNDLSDLPHCVGYLPQLRRIVMDGNPCLRRIRHQLLNDTRALKAFLRTRGGPPMRAGYNLDAGQEAEGGAAVGRGAGGAGSGSSASTGVGSGGGGGQVKVSRPTNSNWRNIINDALVGTFKLDLRNKRLDSLPGDLRNDLSKPDGSAAGSSGRQGGYNNYDDNTAPVIDTVGKRIRRLDLSNNALASLDDGWFEALPNLVRLDSVKNRIDSLPESMANVSLAEIIMSRNLLTSEAVAQSVLCRSMSLLSRSLTTLDLSGNRLEWFPSEICNNLPNLARLVLSGNGIKTLAIEGEGQQRRGWTGQQQDRFPLPSLELLDLSSNKITDLGTLPDSLAGVGNNGAKELKTLLLSNNELRTLPPQLGDVVSLTTINLKGNPQRGIRPAVLEKGCDDILAYLRGRKVPTVTNAVATKSLKATGAISTESSRRKVDGRLGASKVVGTGGGGAHVGVAETPAVPAITSSSTNNNNKDCNDNDNEEQMLADRVAELTLTVDEFRMKLNNVHLSEAMKYKMKKDMAKHRAEMIREERKLRALRG